MLDDALAGDLPGILVDAGTPGRWRTAAGDEMPCTVVIDEQDGQMVELPGGLGSERSAVATVPLAAVPDPQVDDVLRIETGAHAGAWRVTALAGRSGAAVQVRVLWRSLRLAGDAATLRRAGAR
jgi:hypothetical protein